MRSVIVDAPTFDVVMNPIKFLDWLADTYQHFDYHPMSEESRIRFTKVKLIGHAKQHWNNRAMTRRAPITNWNDMKEALKEKYLPESYQQ